VIHYGRWYRNGDPNKTKNVKNAGKVCLSEGCVRPAFSKELCKMHGQRNYHHGSPTTIKRGGKNDTRWRGGTTEGAGGYVLVWIDKNDPLYSMSVSGKNYVLEHRLVMARQLGRPLEKHESVHHINGDRKDNRIENLQLRSSNHGPGTASKCLDCGSQNIEFVKI